MYGLKSRFLLAILAAACVPFAAACGDSESSSPASSSAAKTSADSSGSAKLTGHLATLQARLDELSKTPSQIAVSEPVTNPVRNKTAAWIVINAQTAQAAAAGTKEAAALLGWKVTEIKADPTPSSVASAWARSAALKPDVVFSVGFPAAVFQKSADQLKANGTKLVGYAIGLDQSPPPGFDYETESNKALAAWMNLPADTIAIDASGEDAQVAGFWMQNYPVQVAMDKSFSQELTSACEGCSYDSTQMNPLDIGTKFPGQVVSYLQRNPDTQYLMFGYAPMLTGVEAAVKAAGVGKNLKGVLTNSGQKAQWDLMGGPNGFQTFDVVKNDRELGWQLFDAALRLESSQPAPTGVPQYDAPLFVVTPKNVEAFRKSGYAFNPNYKEQYKKLWGLG